MTIPGDNQGQADAKLGVLAAVERIRERSKAGDLAQEAARALNVPVQFLGVDLEFLRTSHQRLSLLLAMHRACLDDFPVPVAEALREAASKLDVDYFEAETPKVLEETGEGLARVARLVGALHEFARDPRPGDAGGYFHVS